MGEKNVFLGGAMSVRRGRACLEGGNVRPEEGSALSGGRNVCPEGGNVLSGKSVSPVPPPKGCLGGVVGESEAKWGYESPAPPQGILCGGHGGDSDLHEAATSATSTRHAATNPYITLTFTPNETPKMSQNLRYLLVALLIMYISAVPNS